MDKHGRTGHGDWDRKAAGDSENFLSYDEIKIAALIQLSTETSIINAGGRFNRGEPGLPGQFIDSAVYVGAVGARFEKPGKMEHEDIVVSTKPWGQDGAGFEITEDGRYFDVNKYKARMKQSFETFLIEANTRGVEHDQSVYCHVVGLGLGVWQLHGYPQQTGHFLHAFLECLNDLLDNKQLETISDIDFSWIKAPTKIDFKNERVNIHFSKRDPFEKLQQKVSL